MAQQNEEHLEVISKNKAKAFEEQKEIAKRLVADDASVKYIAENSLFYIGLPQFKIKKILRQWYSWIDSCNHCFTHFQPWMIKHVPDIIEVSDSAGQFRMEKNELLYQMQALIINFMMIRVIGIDTK